MYHENVVNNKVTSNSHQTINTDKTENRWIIILLSRHLLVQSQRWKQRSNLFQVNNRWRRSGVFSINLEQISLCSGVPIGDFRWGAGGQLFKVNHKNIKTSLCWFKLSNKFMRKITLHIANFGLDEIHERCYRFFTVDFEQVFTICCCL